MKQLLLFAAVLLQAATGLAAGTLRVDTLRCEYLENPLGVGEEKPRLSWVARSEERGAEQTGYQILVASSPEELAKDSGDLWDTAKVESPENSQIVYEGRPLASKQQVWWKVRVWDGAGEASDWSEPATWEMGLLKPEDWKGKWIEAPDELTRSPDGPDLAGAKWIWKFGDGNVRHFERRFDLPNGKLESAKLTITADDMFEVLLNGRMVSPLDEKNNWRHPRIFDLRPLLKPGENVLSIKVVDNGGEAGLCAKVVIQQAGEVPLEVVTDAQWKVSRESSGTKVDAQEVADFGEGVWGKDVVMQGPRPVPILRKTFSVDDKPIKRARLRATALGLYQFHLNGKKVGDRELAPEWTDYKKRVMYQVYDVTDLVKPGANALATMLGDGWFSGRVAWSAKIYGDRNALKADLEIDFEDGTTQVVATDESWKAHKGPILHSDMLDGESYDARLEVPGWDDTKVDDSRWANAKLREGDSAPIVWQPSEPVRVLTELPAREVKSRDGAWIVDLGQNMVGRVRIRVNVPAGTEITIRHAEMLNTDGSFYTDNYRDAPCVNTYIAKGGGEEVWEPLFFFTGFRYVEIKGLDKKPAPDMVTGVVIGSDTPMTGEFSCSDPMINQLWSNIVWGQRGNYLSVPTDCPQRNERLGWLGDAQVFIRTATENADVAAFFTKWLIDVSDAQFEDGRFPDVAPRVIEFGGTPGWGDAGVICPWTIYEVYGDTRILERHYDAMVRWIEWCKANSTGLIRDRDRGNDHGDWLSINANTPKEVIGTAYFAYSTDLLSRAAKVLGRDDDAAKYRQLFEDIKKAFIEKYVKSDGRVEGETQTSYLMALRFNLLPDDLREKAAQHLVEDIREKGNHLSTGFLGVSYLLPVLTDMGYSDVALTLLTQTTFPSWLFSVEHGATTIWERWDGWTPEKGFQDPGMNSFNHYSLGSCGQWMFDSLAGVGMDSSAPAYRKLWIEPQIGGKFTEVKARVETARGTAGSAWKLAGNKLTLDCMVPVGSTATVVLPTEKAASIREGGKPLSEVKGVKPLRTENGKTYLSVVSGKYRFTCEK